MSARAITKNIIIFALILLWVYAAVSKLIDWEHFKWEMHNQVLPGFITGPLVYLLPIIELSVAALLLFERTFLTAIYLSLGLMVLFTGYIALVLGHAFRHIPCSCGGILSHMGWSQHLIFNLFFIALTLTAIIIFRKGGTVTTKN